MPRHYKKKGRRFTRTYKKVLNFAPTAQSTGNHTNVISNGQDTLAIGQTGPTNASIPTGWFIEFIELQYSAVNLVNTTCFIHTSLQLVHSGQSVIDPIVVGGNPQRNQVFHQDMKSLGQTQNGNWKFRFKIPRQYQRVREGDSWNFTYNNTAIVTDAMQVIYKAKS